MTEDDLKTAAKVHYSFLPMGCSNRYVDVDVKAKPLGIVGGDYCSILPIDSNRLLLNMCDVTNHNVASALYAARLNTFVLTQAQDDPDPCALIINLNEFLVKQLSRSRLYASFCSVLLDFEKMEMKSASAGHPPILHFKKSENAVDALVTKAPFLGYQHPLPISCRLRGDSLGRGDKIVLYTDGLSEMMNKAGDAFGSDGIAAFTEKHWKQDSGSFNKRLIRTAVDHGNHRIEDDILVMTITVK